MQSPFLAISHTVDVILLNIANVFQIRSALAGFKETAVGLESFSFCSVEEREGEREREFNSHRIGLEHQHGRRFVVLEH